MRNAVWSLRLLTEKVEIVNYISFLFLLFP